MCAGIECTCIAVCVVGPEYNDILPAIQLGQKIHLDACILDASEGSTSARASISCFEHNMLQDAYRTLYGVSIPACTHASTLLNYDIHCPAGSCSFTDTLNCTLLLMLRDTRHGCNHKL